MKISAESANRIQRAIDEFAADPAPFFVAGEESGEKIDLRRIAREINVLPLTFDWFACWGLNPDGAVILFRFEKPYVIKTERNQKIVNIVFFDAAGKYPALADLRPVRNPGSIVCPGCDGTGVVKEFADHEFLAEKIRCNCGGVGWLPSADKKYLYF